MKAWTTWMLVTLFQHIQCAAASSNHTTTGACRIGEWRAPSRVMNSTWACNRCIELNCGVCLPARKKGSKSTMIPDWQKHYVCAANISMCTAKPSNFYPQAQSICKAGKMSSATAGIISGVVIGFFLLVSFSVWRTLRHRFGWCRKKANIQTTATVVAGNTATGAAGAAMPGYPAPSNHYAPQAPMYANPAAPPMYAGQPGQPPMYPQANPMVPYGAPPPGGMAYGQPPPNGVVYGQPVMYGMQPPGYPQMPSQGQSYNPGAVPPGYGNAR